ncbi:MAG: DegT/DnrJ/EryC1/StrS family aminotransferase [Chloroflexi bacterium]|nr:DegT/DnrJ/EryC1/StrS family aminotransferase [Chloroflexota bacterium]
MSKNKTLIVPMSYPDITNAEREAVMGVLQTPNLSMGPQIDLFEKSVADFIGVDHAIGVNSGTAGLHLCVRAADIQQGDLVITTPFSFVASTNVILFEKAIPVFVDVDPKTGNIDPILVEQAICDLRKGGVSAGKWLPRQNADFSGKLKAILAVDVFGQPADYDPLRKIAAENGIKLIEDSCESLGAEYKAQKTGLLGDYGVFAFYPNKQITTGEGGMIVTNDGRAAGYMRAMRSQGRAPGDNWLQHTVMGYNYRLDEMSAALGRVQMARIEELLAKRQQVANWYGERIAPLSGVEAPVLSAETTRVSWFVYVIRFDPDLDRDQIAARLTGKGIPVRPYFLPIHLQPYLVQQFGYQEGDFPITEDLGKRGLALPFSGAMTEDQVDQVCQVLVEVLPR